MDLFPTESVVLDLDSHVCFENFSWSNENSTKIKEYDQEKQMSHTRPCCEATGSFLGVEFADPLLNNSGGQEESVKSESTNNDLRNWRECLCNENTDNQRNITNNLMQLSSVVQDDTSFERNSFDSSLKYLLEQTTSLDIDLDTLLLDDNRTDGLSLGSDRIYETTEENKHLLCPMGSADHFLETPSQSNGMASDLQRDEVLTNDLDFECQASSNHSFDSSQLSTLPSDSTGDFLLDLETAPLSLEELFTRTFNEELGKPASSDCVLVSSEYGLVSSDCDLVSREYSLVPNNTDVFLPGDELQNNVTDFYSCWTDPWHSDYLESLDDSRISESDACVTMVDNVATTENKQNPVNENGFSERKSFEPSPNSTQCSQNYKRYSKNNGNTSQISEESSQNTPVSTDHRLARVRKYQRLSKYSPSCDIERNFPCSYPDCAKFYAKLSHLKAHLRRHR